MLIEEIMIRDIFTLTPTNTVFEALELMKEKRIRHIPIVTNKDEIVGLITDRDLKEAIPSTLMSEHDQKTYHTELSNIMIQNLIIGHPLDFVEESALIFYEQQIGCLPIVSNQKLVGLITETDLLYNYIELTGAHQPGSQIEVRVPNVPGILFEVSKVFHEQQINVLSVLVYPDHESDETKILVLRIKTMNPLNIIHGLRSKGFEVLWPKFPGKNL